MYVFFFSELYISQYTSSATFSPRPADRGRHPGTHPGTTTHIRDENVVFSGRRGGGEREAALGSLHILLRGEF